METSSTTASSLSHHKTEDSCWLLCIICSEQQEKESGELHSLPSKQSPSFAAQIRLSKMEDSHPQHSSFCHPHKGCGKGKKSELAVCAVTGSSHIRNRGRENFKELPGCTSSLDSTFPAPASLQGSDTAAGCHPPSLMPWLILVSSRCSPPYNTGLSERVTGKNPFRDVFVLILHTVTPGPMELRTKLQAWHTACRKKGSGGSHSVPAVLDKMGWVEQKSPTQPLCSESRASHHAPQTVGSIKSCNLLLSV